MKKEITVKFRDLRYDFDSAPIDEAIKALRQAKTEAEAEGLTGLYLDLDVESDYGGDWFAYLRVIGKRLETDDEYAVRTQRDLTAQQYREAVDRKKYEELKAKFG